MNQNTILPPDQIIISRDLQARDGLNTEHVNDIAEAIRSKVKVKRPRVMLIDDPEDKSHHDKIYAIDQHRVEAYRRAGKDCPCVKLVGTWQDARDLAATANTEHTALKRDHEAIANAVRMTLEDHPEWTDNRIAKWVKASPTTVGKLRPTVKVAAETTERVGTDKKKYKAGKKAAAQAAKPEANGAPVSSSPKHPALFDWPRFDREWGWITRGVPTLVELTGEKVGGKKATAGLNAALKFFEKCRKATTKPKE